MKKSLFFIIVVFTFSGCLKDEEINCEANYFEFEYEFINRDSPTGGSIQIYYSLYTNICNEPFFREADTGESFTPGIVEKGMTITKRLSTKFFPKKEFELNPSFYSTSSSSPLTVSEGDLLRVIYENDQFTATIF